MWYKHNFKNFKKVKPWYISLNTSLYVFLVVTLSYISVYVARKPRLPSTLEVVCGVVSGPEVSNPFPFCTWNYCHVSYFHIMCAFLSKPIGSHSLIPKSAQYNLHMQFSAISKAVLKEPYWVDILSLFIKCDGTTRKTGESIISRV